MQLKVAHINTAKDWRGGERQVFNLACGLKDACDQLIIARRNSELARRCREAGLQVLELPLLGEWDLYSVAKIAQALDDFQADILHAHTARAHSLGLMARKRQSRRSTIFLVSRRVDFAMRGNFLSRKKYFHKLLDGYIAISENVRQILIQDGVDPAKIQVVYSGIDLQLWQSPRNPIGLRSELRLHPDMLILGNVAALVDHKDHHTLLDALQILEQNDADKLPVYRFFIVGQGELEKELLGKARKYGLLEPEGPLVFTGYRTDVYDFYAIFNIFVMSSKEEGLGTAVLDAMAAGLPVVSTAAGGIPEMIDHDSGGLLSPVRDAKELARNLAAMMQNRDFIKKAGSYNKKKVQQFSHEQTCQKTLKVYQDFYQSKQASV